MLLFFPNQFHGIIIRYIIFSTTKLLICLSIHFLNSLFPSSLPHTHILWSLFALFLSFIGHIFLYPFGELSFIKSSEMADEIEYERLDELSSYGKIGDDRLVCRYIEKHASKGIFRGDNPLHHDTSMLIIEIILIFIVGRMIQLLLKSCHQTQFISHVVVGFFFFIIFNTFCLCELSCDNQVVVRSNLETRSTFFLLFLFCFILFRESKSVKVMITFIST